MPIELATPALIALFAHPDDEFGVFPWLSAAIAAGRDVHCLYLTDGAYGGQDPAPRRRESTSVLAAVGIPAARLQFLGEAWHVPDGGLHQRLDEVIPAVCAIVRKLAPTAELLVPAWEAGHQDHDAAHLVGLALTRELPLLRLRQFSLYHGAGLPGSLFRVLAPLAANGPTESIAIGVMERLRCVARCVYYRSQWKSFLGLMPPYALRMLGRAPFKLQPVDPARSSDRPHPGAPLYERRGGPSWTQFADATRAWRYPASMK